MFKRLQILTIAIIICSCSSPNKSNEIDFKALWNSQSLDNYIIEQSLSCFCPNGGRMAHLNISSDSIVNGYYLDSNMTSYDSQFVHHKSINQLFDWLEYLVSINPDRIDIVYDSTYGYPKYIFVDRHFEMVDEEMGYFTELILVE